MPFSRVPVEVFCSYAHEDEESRQQLEKHVSALKRQGLISLWHDRQILPGTDCARAIDEHLETALIIVLLMSANFVASDYCYTIEMKRALERHQAGEARVVPVVVRPCDWLQLPVGKLQSLPADAKPISEYVSVDEAWTQVVTGLRGIIEDLSHIPAIDPQMNLPQVWMIPYARNPFFLGRHELLDQLHTLLQPAQSAAIGQPQAISGLGGIGKTQIAVEYAYRFHQEYQAVLWVRADSVESLNLSYTTCAAMLNLPQKDSREQAVIVQAVKSWLSNHRSWLLILDSADEPNLLRPFLPSVASGHILLTTRAMNLGGLGLGIAYPMEVETFSLDQGALFLLRRANLLAFNATLDQSTRQDEELAKQITHELGGLPLALDQAGAYLAATGSSLATYLQIYQHYRLQLLSERRNRDYPESVATTWNISFERVKIRNPAATELLRFCAFLAPDAIPEEIFIKGASRLGPVLASVASNAYLFNQAIEALRAYSLIARNPQMRMFSLHRLVQVVLRETLPMQNQQTGWRHFLQNLWPDPAYPKNQQQWALRVIQVMNATFPSVEPGNWSQCERLLPHALVCAFWIERSFLDILATAWPVFIWGGLASLALAWLWAHISVGIYQTSDGRLEIRRPSLGIGIGQSIWLGVSEELGLRWLAFYCLIALLNWLGSFPFFGVLPWFYTSIIRPVVNFITFGWLSNILFHPNWTWAVGAAIVLLSFYRYERGSELSEPGFSPIYGGNLARLVYFFPANLFLYLVMFRHGIIAAILVHAIYEVFFIVLVLTIRRRIISAEYIRLWGLSEPDKSNSQKGN